MKNTVIRNARLVTSGVIICLLLISQIAKADYVFGEPALMGPPVTQNTTQHGACVSPDGLEVYFDHWQSGQTDIFMATRMSVEDDWGEAVALGTAVNGPAFERTPCISADGLELYYASSRVGSIWSGFQIFVARRERMGDAWQQAENLGPMINSSQEQTVGSLSADGLELYYSTGNRMRVALRDTRDSDWTETKAIAPTIPGGYPAISSGGLHLIFCTDALPGAIGSWDLWMMTRATIDGEWGDPVNLDTPINTTQGEGNCWLLHDGSALLFGRGGAGSNVWQVPIHLILDLDGDGRVNTVDMHIMVDHWGRDTSLCDIAPAPFGDGIVDIKDLTLLSEYMEPVDMRLLTHWRLDETVSTVAADAALQNDGLLIGDPTWMPAEGILGGALQFDGIDDYIEGPFILNPQEGAFSFCAWIKTSESSQVIVSQAASNLDWLSIDSSGRLTTALSFPIPLLLTSDSVVADGAWHHISLVADRAGKTLYIDGLAEASDDKPAIMPCFNGLNIGTGQALDPDSFFTGLIDDVRIYNQVLEPDEIAELAQ